MAAIDDVQRYKLANENMQLKKRIAELERERDEFAEVAKRVLVAEDKARAEERRRYKPLVEVATRCHEQLGFLAMHLAGRMAEGALHQIALLADETRETIRALGDE